MKKQLLSIFLFLISLNLFSQNFISDKKGANSFLLCSSSQPTFIYVDSTDDWLVNKAVSLLQTDIEMVTGKKPMIVHDINSVKGNGIVIGSLEKSSIVSQLIQQKRINPSGIKNKWESFLIQSNLKSPLR